MFIHFKRKIYHYVNHGFNAWLNRRMPSKANQRLAQNNIFILPTRFGVAFIVFILLLFILGTNYQNNLIIIMCYLFSSLFLTTMFYTYFNMAGLTISATGVYNGFVEETLFIPVEISSQNVKQSFAINFTEHHKVNLMSVNKPHILNVPVQFNTRGKHTLNRLIIKSEFPLGLFQCWTKLKFDIDVICYPKPLKCVDVTQGVNLDDANKRPNGESSHRIKGEDFYELKPYKIGEPLSHIAWKHVAKGDLWQTKHYSQSQSHYNVLSINDMPSHSWENRVSNLCYLVLQYQQAGIEYGLQIPGKVEHNIIAINSGENHLKQCLTALAICDSPQINT
ncbi:DUF58 domain-containing protein [Colwellia sp. 1_MG-2023]|uniref:DUF58 domain-containing protein n=1 Tax=Colwellia sp. 1_MG-2023 TaxID=3062649 RepID=UPI0026E1E27B|nr:DUF58 domain-containing protein [Colwellia sp. 1_MG-2023]MDO6447292.1 DUF58 domain-containing protein [Colwellia sp. 1_MG-2023]